jgi:hypothetical protein
MSPEVCALLLLVLAFPSLAADVPVTPQNANPRSDVPLHIGAMIGVVSVPRPIDATTWYVTPRAGWLCRTSPT